jgi:hypothetical protein
LLLSTRLGRSGELLWATSVTCPLEVTELVVLEGEQHGFEG